MLILKVLEDDGNEYLSEIENEDEFNEVSEVLMKMVEEKFEVEYFDPEDVEQ